MENKSRGNYNKPVLSAEQTAQLLKTIKKNSRLKQDELESALEIGAGMASETKSGNYPGNTFSQYSGGKLSMPFRKAIKILKIAYQNNWISGDERSMYEWVLYEQTSSTEFKRLESKHFKSLENLGTRMISKIFENPELSTKNVWDAIDLVIAPMLKRKLMEEYIGHRLQRMETFAVLNPEIEKWFGKQITAPEERFEKYLDQLF